MFNSIHRVRGDKNRHRRRAFLCAGDVFGRQVVGAADRVIGQRQDEVFGAPHQQQAVLFVVVEAVFPPETVLDGKFGRKG
eukprot:CAMPEP_0194288712 /NCGR_PEP_ID=MMETSP0169-20130528/37459_1 /TAXON_ID=218684 /ORGANISM="Corethron pennatum, Strain L29A3" /LENGTH=79 /DNA_ID=CAMNT_0039035793 /DNA_START=538 /DNA_END=773 /DNA_ORIENTATION=+